GFLFAAEVSAARVGGSGLGGAAEVAAGRAVAALGGRLFLAEIAAGAGIAGLACSGLLAEVSAGAGVFRTLGGSLAKIAAAAGVTPGRGRGRSDRLSRQWSRSRMAGRSSPARAGAGRSAAA